MERVGGGLCMVAVCASLLAAVEDRARAAEVMVSLEYVAGPSCPNVDEFRTVVVARLGRDPFNDSAANHVLVRIAPREGALDGRIEWRDASGKWVGDQSFPLVTVDCLRLVRSMGFALAVQIQLLEKTNAEPAATARSEMPTPNVTPAPKPAGPPAPPSLPSTEPPMAPVRTHPVRSPGPLLTVGAGPSVGFGMSSTPVLFGRLFGGAAWPRVSLELAAEVSFPTTTRRADGAGFSQQHLLASAGACARVSRWNGCLLINAGEIRMAGENIDRTNSAAAPLVQAGARVGIVQHLGHRFFVDAHADGLANVTRWTATLDQVPVWTAPRVSAVVGIDVGALFP